MVRIFQNRLARDRHRANKILGRGKLRFELLRNPGWVLPVFVHEVFNEPRARPPNERCSAASDKGRGAQTPGPDRVQPRDDREGQVHQDAWLLRGQKT